MKNTRELLFQSLIMLILSIFTFTLAHAQEEKEEKKVVKMKVMAEDDGNVRIDTMFVLDEDFDGDWEKITDDEEILKKLKEMDIDIDVEGDVYIIRAPHTQKKAYFYSTDTDEEGNVKVDVEIENAEGGYIEVITKEFVGDSTVTIMLKTADCKKSDEDHQVLIWHSDEDGEQKEYKVVTVKTDKMDIDKTHGESEVTYMIKLEEGEDAEKVMIWHSDDDDPDNNIIIKEIEGDSIKVFVTTTDDAKGDVKVIKKKEIIIITDEEHDCDHDHDKDKDKDKKKKKKNDK